MKKIIVLFFFILICFTSCQTNFFAISREKLIEYEPNDLTNDIERINPLSIEKLTTSNLAWNQSYTLQSFLILWEANHESKYLEEFIKRVTIIINNRDMVRNLFDWQGKSGPVWQDTYYTKEHIPYNWVVHAGMIIYPLAWFYDLAQKNPQFFENLKLDSGKSGVEISKEYKEVCDLAIQFFEEDWVYNSELDQGHYIFNKDATFTYKAGGAIPFNMQNAMGRVFIKLYNATGESKYRLKAQALANFFHSKITFSKNRAFWNYWDTDTFLVGEDISHASINADFIRLCVESNIVFSEEDLQSVTETIPSFLSKNYFSISDLLGGGTMGRYEESIAMWGGLSKYQPYIAALALNIINQKGMKKANQISRQILSAWIKKYNLIREYKLVSPIKKRANGTKLRLDFLANAGPQIIRLKYKSDDYIILKGSSADLVKLPPTKQESESGNPWVIAYIPVFFIEGKASIEFQSNTGNYNINIDNQVY